MTQRTASTRFDLPQPFGPTTPVSPGSISKSVGSTKDLKPIRRSRVSFIRVLLPSFLLRRCRESLKAHAVVWRVEDCRIGAENESSCSQAQQRRHVIQIFALAGAGPRARSGRPGGLGEAEKPLSFLEIGVDDLGQRVDRLVAGKPFAVDEEGRYGIDPELLGGAV